MMGFWEVSDESSVLLFLGLTAEMLDFPHWFPGVEKSPGGVGENRDSSRGKSHLCEGLFS